MILPIHHTGEAQMSRAYNINNIERGNASAAKRKHFVKQIAARLMSRCTEIRVSDSNLRTECAVKSYDI